MWSPPDDLSATRLTAFAAWVADRRDLSISGYDDLWRWSVAELRTFWSDIATYFDVAQDVPPAEVLVADAMPGAQWFPGVQVNFAEALLGAVDDSRNALIAETESGAQVRLTGAQLRQQVASLAAALRRMGVEPGDRVAAYLPNTQHAVIAFLASASVGAVWAVCAPDFGVRSVLDRLAQTRPTVLIAADGYHFGGQRHDRSEAALEILAELPTVRTCVWVDHLAAGVTPSIRGREVVAWSAVVSGREAPSYAALPFDHPLWILFSSGTTGIPKGIVHGHGGMLLEQCKNMLLQTDVRPGDVFYWYSSTAWMMWNIVVSALLGGATIVLYDGSPTFPDLDRQWALAHRWRLTHFGTSAGYLTACAGQGLRPGAAHDLSALRFVGSTGSPLPAESARWVHDAVGAAPQLVSMSGGTDIATTFVAATPWHRVWAGEISAPMLGVAMDAWDAAGRPVTGRDGELVVTAPMPSMPIFFWDDPDGSRYRDAYFSTYPGVWRHGDWIRITDRGSLVLSGRSDSTLNRGGVRMGTADVYAAVEQLPQVADCMMLGVEQEGGGYWMPLFVQLEPGSELDEELRARIREAIVQGATRRHVPDEIIAVPAIPRTRTGKRVEVPIKRIFQGVPAEEAASAGSLADPTVIEQYAAIARDRRTSQ